MATYPTIDITGQFDEILLESGNSVISTIDITGQFDEILLESGNSVISTTDITGQFDEILLESGNSTISTIDITGQFDEILLEAEFPQSTRLLPEFNVDTIVDPATIIFNEGDNEPTLPVASFIPSAVAGNFPLTVTFTNTSTGTITETHWEFGDGGVSTSNSPSHVYITAGTYTVYLRIFEGPYYSQATTTINVLTSLYPDFTADVTSGSAPLPVQFTNLTLSPTIYRTISYNDAHRLNLKGAYLWPSGNPRGVWYDKINNRLWVIGNSGSTGNIRVLSFNGTTFTLLATETTYTTGVTQTAIYGDGTYVYSIYATGIAAYTYSAGAITRAGVSTTTITGGHDLFVDTQGYVYAPNNSSATDNPAFLFDGSSFIVRGVGPVGGYLYAVAGNGNRLFTAYRNGATSHIDAWTFNGYTFVNKGTLTLTNNEQVFGLFWDGVALVASVTNSSTPYNKLRYINYNGTSFTEVGTGTAVYSYGCIRFDGNCYYVSEGSIRTSAYIWNGASFTLVDKFPNSYNAIYQNIALSGPTNGKYVFVALSDSIVALKIEPVTQTITTDDIVGASPLTVNFTSV